MSDLYDPILLEYLVPLLQDTIDGESILYNPGAFLDEYGQYITKYDPTKAITSGKQGELMQESILASNIGDLRAAENISGATGITSGDINSKINQTFDQIIHDLMIGDMQSLEAQKYHLQSYGSSLTSDIGTLAMLGAFDPSEGAFDNPALNPYSSEDVEWDYMMDQYGEYIDEDLWVDTGGD